MLTRAWMEVDLGALVRNAMTLADRAGVPLIPMIKDEAYGLGAEQVSRALEPLSPLAYGVATVVEGEELRACGIDRPILVFTPLLIEEMEAAHLARLTPVLGSREEIEAWSIYGSPYNLSIDTGMSRAGVQWRDMENLRSVITRHPPSGAFTHFHSAQLDDGSMDEQERRFREAVDKLPDRPAILHTDNSAAIARHGRSQWDAVRPGVFMYGVGSGASAAVQPDPVVYVKARVVATRWVEAGDTVSYDATWTAPSRRLIATIPLGYGDGYPRGASNAGFGLVRGFVVPIVGRVTMDMIMLDVTETGVEPGDVVTMIGDAAAARAPIDVAGVAAIAGISAYEILTGLRGRLRRIYTGQAP
ncbi:MAG: alanine racemase [Gemmatimonadales bacterium]